MRLSEQIASQLHEKWRQTRLSNGVYEPRWKKVKDAGFAERAKMNIGGGNLRTNDNGEVEIDIANTSYFDLSPDWQAENKAAGEVIERIILSGKDYTLDEVGEIIHSEWLKRNDWAKDDPILSQPFAKLPVSEQRKDLEQYEVGLAAYEEMVKENKNAQVEHE